MKSTTRYRDEEAIKAFAEKVRALRVETGLTIEQFANNIGFFANQLGRIERGEINPTLSTITFLAKHLGVTPQELITFE